MQGAANFVRGWVWLQVVGACPEEFFNRCARESLGFWAVKKLDATTWTCRVSVWDWKRVEPLAARTQCEVTLLRRGGIPGFLWRLRRRYALLVGLALCLVAVGVANQFVLTVRVSGNVRVPTGAILTQLRARGVKPGAFGPGVDTRQVCHEVILELPELSWMSINLHGTVCDVLVREGVPRPELVDEGTPAHVVAKYPGIITRIDVTRGQQMVERGNTVAAGDTLIGSWVDFVEPQYYEGDMGGMLVRAGGRVRARTWHTLKASIPLEGQAKAFTGREKSRWSLEVLDHSIKFYRRGGISYDKYDKITSYHTARLPVVGSLPLSLKKETCREYEPESREIDRQRAADALKGELQERLEAMARPEEIKRVDWAVTEGGGLLTVTLLAECEQDIGVTVED